ncbi:hypothetical protein GGF46_001764 [Coemansia sp. RSA 552]|nr:hypothetical protein GGF46_001764 [Coemansia sp. RSA 552]
MHAIRRVSLRLPRSYSPRLCRLYSDATKDGSDARHEEFTKSFMKALESHSFSKKNVPDNPEELKADIQLAEAVSRLFSKHKVDVTPELLEKRKELREKYPKLFQDIADEDLDR